ncbi:unnamed protein product [Acanthoscelides obtectus]|uniref:Uncharacterized protein n=1 Tax=Acanthoscelides obtectus TaxID=200917 RepID=A0A9P0PYC3_ACAOB|nr:unnamed protein product [Acanthoscelides obtectus]CAK1680539.1 hypothetical protein AOBTE_LOCUS32740 [Acanthoscelides obtectus]
MYRIDGLLLEIPYPVERPSSAYSSQSSQSQLSDCQMLTQSPMHSPQLYAMQPSRSVNSQVPISIPETNDTPQNQQIDNIIAKAYWNASQM